MLTISKLAKPWADLIILYGEDLCYNIGVNPETYSLAYRTRPMPARIRNSILVLSYCLLASVVTCVTYFFFAFLPSQGSTAAVLETLPTLKTIFIFTTIITIALGILYYYALYVKWYTPTKIFAAKVALIAGSLSMVQTLSIIGAVILYVIMFCVVSSRKSARLAETKDSCNVSSTPHDVRYIDISDTPQDESKPQNTPQSAAKSKQPIGLTTQAIASAEKDKHSRNNAMINILIVVGAVNALITLWWFIPLLEVLIFHNPDWGTIQTAFAGVAFGSINLVIGIIGVILLSVILFNKTSELQKTDWPRYLAAAIVVAIPLILVFFAFAVMTIIHLLSLLS